MWAAILAALAPIFTFLNKILDFLKKPAAQKVEDAQNQVHQDDESRHESGRPKWHD